MQKEKNDQIHSYKISELKKSTSEMRDFEIYRFEYFVKDIDHLKLPHRHDHFALFFITKGKGQHLIDFTEYDLQTNRIFFLSAAQIHAWRGNQQAKGFAMLFTREFFNVNSQVRQLRDFIFFNTLQPQPLLDLDTEQAQHFIQLFENIEDEYLHNNNHRKIIIRSYLNVLLYQLVRIYELSFGVNKNQAASVIKVSEFEKLVNAKFLEVRMVADYAKLLFITPNYLNSICKKTKAKAASEIIQDRLILEAKRLLTYSKKSIAEIAFQLNYEDNSYFGRAFKKNVGQTPLEFRTEQKRES